MLFPITFLLIKCMIMLRHTVFIEDNIHVKSKDKLIYI